MSIYNSIHDLDRQRDSSKEKKDKRVHFSIIKGNSFEDLQNARKDKEKQLEDFLIFKQMSNNSIKESIEKINRITYNLDSQLSNFQFSNTAKNDPKISRKIDLEENLSNSNNFTNKNYAKENLESNFDKYMISENTNENFNYDPNKKCEGLDLSSNSSIRQSGIEKKSVKPSININELGKNKYNNNNSERRNSNSSNSVISEVSHSSKKSQKFEKNVEKIKNINNNLNYDDNFINNLMNKIDQNLSSDKLLESSNNFVDISQKTSNFGYLDKHAINKDYSNKIVETKQSDKKGDIEEELNKSIHSNYMKNNVTQTQKVDNLNNLMNNLSNNNTSVYHSFGDHNQFQPTFKPNLENNQLIENNSIELLQSLNTSKREELLHKTITNMTDILDKNLMLNLKSVFDYINHETGKNIELIHYKEKCFFFIIFLRKIRFLALTQQKQMRRKDVKRIAEQHLIIMKNDLKKRIFKEMNRICDNQKQWVNKIRYEFSKNSLWQLLDNWKVFVNYKKIKRYFKNKLKEKSFKSLQHNMKSANKIEEKSIKLFYILNMKYCIYKMRLNSKISRKYYTNLKLASEFRQDKLKNKVFKMIRNYTSEIISNRKKQYDKLTNKNKNCEYINLKIIHNTQIKNKKTESGETVTRITKNNIKII